MEQEMKGRMLRTNHILIYRCCNHALQFMPMRLNMFLAAALVSLTGCAWSGPDDGIFKSNERNIVRIPALDLSIRSDQPLQATKVSLTDDFELTGSGVTIYIQRIPYDEESQGLADFMIPSSVGKLLDDDDACIVLGETEETVYLPVQTDRLMQCAPFTNAEGTREIAAIGFADTFESTDYPGSMILIPRKNDAIVLWNIVPFPEVDVWLQEQVDAFNRDHPTDTLWPPTTPQAQEMYDNVTRYIGRMLSDPPIHLIRKHNVLETWTKRITLD